MWTELLGVFATVATAVTAPILLPGPRLVTIPAGLFSAYVVLETLFPAEYLNPGPNIACESGDDDEAGQ